MGDEILKKLDIFTTEASVYSVGYPKYSKDRYDGVRPIQFLNWWGNFRPGDRVDVLFAEDYISFAGTNAEGQFAGVKKELEIDNPDEMDEFKSSEGKIWNFV
jgi:hypothetical protein